MEKWRDTKQKLIMIRLMSFTKNLTMNILESMLIMSIQIAINHGTLMEHILLYTTNTPLIQFTLTSTTVNKVTSRAHTSIKSTRVFTLDLQKVSITMLKFIIILLPQHMLSLTQTSMTLTMN